MAAKNGQTFIDRDVSSKDMTVEEFSNIFASEFNNSEIHDRVLCFQIIKDKEFGTKDDESQSESECRAVSSIYISGVRTSVIRSMRKVKPSESKMAAIDVQ